MASGDGNTSPHAKRPKLSHEPKKEDDEVCLPAAGRLELVRFKTCSIAVKWQEDGCPMLDFLSELGLHWLSTIQWSVAYSPGVEDFIFNYDPETDATKVGNTLIRLDPEMVSQALRIPNTGSPVIVRNQKAADTLNFFKEGACNGEQGFRNDMTNDASVGRMFSLIGEAVLLKHTPSFTTAPFLDVLTSAKQGEVFNWAGCISQRLRQRVLDVKEKTSKRQTVRFSGGAYIAHFIKALGLKDEEEVDVKPSVRELSEAVFLTPRNRVLQLVPGSAPPPGCVENSARPCSPRRARSASSKGLNEDVKVTTLISDLAGKLEMIHTHAQAQEESMAREKEQLEKYEGVLQELQESKEALVILRQGLENADKLIGELKKSEERLKESNKSLKKRKKALKSENGNLLLDLEAAQLENLETVRLADEFRKKFQDDMREQEESSSKQLESKNKEIESLVATVTELRTELQAKSFSYGSELWEKVQAEAWKQTRAAYKNLVDTIDDLQREVEKQKSIDA